MSMTLIQFLPNTFDIIIADPPYGVRADKFGDAAQTSSQVCRRRNVRPLYSLKIIFRLGFDWAREDAHLFMFCDVDLFGPLES